MVGLEGGWLHASGGAGGGASEKKKKRTARVEDYSIFVLPGRPGHRQSVAGYVFADDDVKVKDDVSGMSLRVVPSGEEAGQRAIAVYGLEGGPSCRLCKQAYDSTRFFIGCNFCSGL